ncbi:MAG TPA: FKBP-type peptidyl-prolyl cis-trans isomerase [Mucilaginibacter sp.]|jgi:FKBP-type peptidyl-prolyl cis-trans isomerase FkpA|nr:FKBP-type peptidyl-prolyl cis-trans isomerase [Mucilaginibacter sp.]
MNRCFLPILLLAVVIAGCGKTQSDVAQYKAQATIDDKIVTNYISQNNLTDTVHKVSDTSGAYYIVINPGSGNDIFTSSTQVTVSYVGRLLTTGKIFSRTDTSAFTPSYVLGQTILGWQLGIPKIKKGGEVRLLLPSRYAYGPYAQQQLGLPANAVLDFDIKLYNITN